MLPFDLDSTYLIYGLAAASAVLMFQSLYVMFFSTASYRRNINRRLRLASNEPNRENLLIQLRRERGLTSGGRYQLNFIALNRLVVQSGLSIGLQRLAMIVALVAVAVFGLVMVFRHDLLEALLAATGSAVIVPYASLKLLRRRRQAKFAEQFPDAIDIIVRSLRAGHPVPVAISMVAREMTDPIGTEFGIVADEITYGAELEAAMRNLSFRVGQDDLPLFVTAVAIQSSTGGNLSEILHNLSTVIRLRFKMRRKIKALAAEGKFSAMFLSGLPIVIFGLLQFVTPNYYSSVWDQSLTKIGLGCAIAWMGMGNFAMYRLVNFRI